MPPTGLVLLPGLDGTGVLMRPLVAALPAALVPTVVAYPPTTPRSYAELVPIALAALPKDRDFVLLGESFGGPLALMTAAARPPGLRGVVLCATFVRCPHAYVPKWAHRLAHPAALRLFPTLSRTKMLLGGHATPELLALSVEALGLVSADVLAARLREVLAVDATKELAACPVPVLYIRGAKDRVVPARNLRQVLRIRPSARVATLDAPHMVLQTRPAAAAKAIAEFVRSPAGARRQRT